MKKFKEFKAEIEEDVAKKYTLSALGKKDKAVIDAFFKKEKATGSRLHTDGKSLDIMGLGGRGVVTWNPKNDLLRRLILWHA